MTIIPSTQKKSKPANFVFASVLLIPYIAGDMSEIATDHAKRIVSQMLRFNHWFSSLEPNAHIVNSTPNASIRIPTSKYKLKKTMQSEISFEYHIRCDICGIYSLSASSRTECDLCATDISTTNSNFFIYIPLEQQLKQVIYENFEEIHCYPSSQDENLITDIHDCLQYKKYQKSTLIQRSFHLWHAPMAYNFTNHPENLFGQYICI